jgi:mannose-6-phosphate isomerase-like protein (cupin superfamily)
MIIRSLQNITAFKAGDASLLRELLHPAKEPLSIGYSLAHALVAPGRATRPHRLKSTEVYYIVEGRGRMRVGEELADVGPGDAVVIPSGSVQSIENIGPGDLAFLCVVEPAWRAEDEEIL